MQSVAIAANLPDNEGADRFWSISDRPQRGSEDPRGFRGVVKNDYFLPFLGHFAACFLPVPGPLV